MILVTGATGNVGSELVPQLLALEQQIRVLTRDERKVADLDARVQRAIGSFDQPETLNAAMQGAEQVFLMSTGEDTRPIEAAVTAAKQAGVRHIVYLSSRGAGIPEIRIGKWHHDREEVVRASGIPWTFLRPGYFMPNVLQWAETIKTRGTVYFPGGEGKTAPIDPRDIAAVAALALTQPGHEGQIYELTGSELLTIREQVEIIARVLDKPLQYVDIPPSAAREQMIQSGMSETLADAVTEVYTLLRTGQGAGVTDTFERVTGKKPRTFEAWCCDHIAAFQ